MEFDQLQHGSSYDVAHRETGEVYRIAVTMKNFYGIQFRMDEEARYWFMSKTVFSKYFEIIQHDK